MPRVLIAVDALIERRIEEHAKHPHEGMATKEDVALLREDIARLRATVDRMQK